MKNLTNLVLRWGILAASFAVPMFAFAIGLKPPGTMTAPGDTIGVANITGSSGFVCVAVNWIFFGLIALAVIFTLVAAYRYVTAAGNPEKVKSASNTLLYAIIAVVVALVARAIPGLAADIIGSSTTSFNICA